MASRWITLTCVLLGAVLLTSAGRTDPQVEQSSQQLELLLETVNELERQRVQENTDWSHKGATAKQRPNSKRLRWNRKRSGVPESRRFAAYSSSITYQPNPDYINVKDHEPTPSPWWYNIN